MPVFGVSFPSSWFLRFLCSLRSRRFLGGVNFEAEVSYRFFYFEIFLFLFFDEVLDQLYRFESHLILFFLLDTLREQLINFCAINLLFFDCLFEFLGSCS